MKRFTFLVFIILFSAIPTYSQVTIHVPADYSTIQAAINVANSGDLVLISEGTYYENINFLGKAITVASNYYVDGKQKHIRKTIIDGSQPSNLDNGSTVSFTTGEDTNSVLCGLTITGGTGTVQNFPGYPPMRQGGGIFCSATGAKIIHNRIVNNTIDNTGWAMGGGFCNGPPFIPTIAILENNLFENNFIEGQVMATGGAIYFNSAGRVVNNKIINNTAFSHGSYSNGGGIALSSWQPPLTYEVLVCRNEILHNKALQSETGSPGISSHGGGLTIIGTKGVISNNIFMFNEISPVDSGFGAGVVLDYPPEDLFFKNNIVSHNYFSGSGNCFGGGVAIWDGSPTLENNLIEKNKGTIGGAIWTGYHFCNAKFFNNTIVKNNATVKGGAINLFNSNLTVMNSILWDNEAPDGSEIFIESGTIDVSYSDVKGGWTGTGNINQNPKMWPFVYLLRFNSPCIDAGNFDVMYNDPESPWHSGYAMFPARGLVRNDMGAYGGPGAIDWYDFLGKTRFDDEELASSVLTPNEIKIDNYPNPFNPQTTIQLELPTDGFVSLKIYNVLGQEVATLVSDNLLAGNYKYVWNASNFASGIYVYRLEANGFVLDKKMILMK